MLTACRPSRTITAAQEAAPSVGAVLGTLADALGSDEASYAQNRRAVTVVLSGGAQMGGGGY